MSEERAGYRVGDASTDTDQPQEGAPTLAQETPPQWFTQVANIYMQAACCEFGLAATRCFLYIVRHTEGFHQEGVTLSIGEFCTGRRRKDGATHDAGTRLTRVSVMAGIEELCQKGVISVTHEGRGRGIVSSYRINAPHLWQLNDLTDGETIGKETIPIENGKESLPITVDIGKETIPIPANNGKDSLPIQVPWGQAASGATGTGNKGSLNKERERKLSCPTPDGADDGASPSSSKPKPRTTTPKPLAEDSEALRLAAYLRDKILAHSPQARDAKAALKPAKLANWAIPIDRMLRLDQRTPEGIRAVIDFATTDDFWHGNILSTGKLRDQYDTLDARRRSKSRPKPSYAPAPTGRAHADRPVPPVNAKPAQLD